MLAINTLLFSFGFSKWFQPLEVTAQDPLLVLIVDCLPMNSPFLEVKRREMVIGNENDQVS